MQNLKRILSLVLVSVMVLSLSACIHKKYEIAVKIGEEKFTSAYYMCSLIYAYTEAQQKVKESDDLTEDEQSGTAEIDYFSKKIDKKDFETWVEDRAIEVIKTNAAYRILCKENKLELDEDQKTQIENNVYQNWDYYGASEYFSPKGVSRDTYKTYLTDSYYSELYFEHLYGKEGEKEVKADDVNKEIIENYILADVIEITYEDKATDEDKAKNKATLEDYASQIKDGKKTFAEIYKTHNEIKDEETATEEDEEELKPVNEYANIFGAEDTDFAADEYETYKKYEVDVPKVSENSDKTGVVLVVKRDISKDEYFMDYLDIYARHSLKDEEFEKTIDDYCKDLKEDVSKYAVSQFKVKDLDTSDTEE